MTREIINTPDALGSATYGSFPYSQAVKAAGLVFVAGQGAKHPLEIDGLRISIAVVAEA